MSKIKASIVGVTGFTGTELLRVLLQHPNVEITSLVSRQHNGKALGELFPRLSHIDDLFITSEEPEETAKKSDVVFLCLPHMASQDIAPRMIGKTKIIDLSADFRLRDLADFKAYYHEDHAHPELLGGTFANGIPELFIDDIKAADNIANPGCFALLAQIMLAPFKGHIQQADFIGVSGTSGGGKKARDPAEHPALSQNMKSYLVNNHRHMPEILQTLELPRNKLNFLPSVGPFLRGIFGTAFVKTDLTPDDIKDVYKDAAFVRVKETVEMNQVVSTNFLDVGFKADDNGNMIVQGTLDNLLKGASGNAVQNMNITFGLDEDAGLSFNTAIYP